MSLTGFDIVVRNGPSDCALLIAVCVRRKRGW